MYIKFWGVRGSVPVPGKETLFFGGNTTCIEVRTDEGKLIIFDAGTGIRALGWELLKLEFGRGEGEAHILFTHTHWDHIQGFPFFMPAYIGGKKDPNNPKSVGNKLHLYGASDVDDRLEATLRGQMEHFYFPVALDNLIAEISFHPLQGKVITAGKTQITARRLIHPNGVLGYRLQEGNKTVVIATDCEHPTDGSLDANLMELAQGADLMIYDAQYTPQEYNPQQHGGEGPSKIGWGHSTPQEGVRVAKTAGVKRLVLTHHDPLHNDDFVRSMEQMAQELFPNSQAAYEGLLIEL